MHPQTTWSELCDRLLHIAKEHNHPPSWLIIQIEKCGHPPWEIWKKLGYHLCYSIDWVNGKWQPRREVQQPDITKIDWESWD